MAATELQQGARVLIVRLSALGDVLFALETVASLAAERPDVTIDFLVEDRFASVLQGHPQIDRVLASPRRSRGRLWSFLKELRAVRYDAVLDVHGILKSALPVLAARADRKLGFTPPGAREGAHLVYGERAPLPLPLPHRAARGYALLKQLGLRGEPAHPVLPKPPSVPPFWSTNPTSGGPRVVLHPGASAFAAFKRWPATKHAELAHLLCEAGYDVAISYGPGEETLAETVAELSNHPECRLLDGGKIGLLGLAETMRQADVVVAADTGPLHLATAAGARVVALFGPKDPSLYGPRGEGHEVLFHDVPCRPCKRRSCVTPQCILGLRVDEVARAVARVVAAARQAS